jgi:hypothetical protein
MNDRYEKLCRELSRTPPPPEGIFDAARGRLVRRTWLGRSAVAGALCLALALGLSLRTDSLAPEDTARSLEAHEELQDAYEYVNSMNIEDDLTLYAVAEIVYSETP